MDRRFKNKKSFHDKSGRSVTQLPFVKGPQSCVLYISLFLVTVLFSENGFAQEPAQAAQIQSLENDFRAFKYEQVLSKGRLLLANLKISESDSAKIYQYMLNSAYALNDTAKARNIIEEIIANLPDYSPDPRITSPKIIEFFDYVKKNKIEFPKREVTSETQPSNQIENKPVTFHPVPVQYLIISVLYPGSSHLMKGHNKRGAVFSGISAVLFGGLVYTSLETGKKRREYMRAQNADFDKLYDRYNSYYKARNFFMVGYVVYNLFTLYDFYTIENKKNQFSLRPSIANQAMKLSLSYDW